MITYCGLRHFYIRHFTPPQPDSFYILTYNGKIWDFSPQLKEYGFGSNHRPNTVYHAPKPVLTLPISLGDFESFGLGWHVFSRQYTDALEPEYPHSWYLRFSQIKIMEQFIFDFMQKLNSENWQGICGAGVSKLVAKLAAHNLPKEASIITAQQTGDFLKQIPLQRLPLPESANLSKLGVKTVGDLATLPLGELSFQFGNRAKTLQKIGRGEDLVSFQPQPHPEFKWELDCTTLNEYLRPLTPFELKPYLKQGVGELVSLLKKHEQVTNLLKLRGLAAHGVAFQTQRQFKEATDDFQVLKRAVTSILPQKPLARVALVASKLEKSSTTQLNMFFKPAATALAAHELPAQVGVQLPRRERLLLLREEYFEDE